MSHSLRNGPSNYGAQAPLAKAPETIAEAAELRCDIVLYCSPCRNGQVFRASTWSHLMVASKPVIDLAWTCRCGAAIELAKIQRLTSAGGMAETLLEWIPKNRKGAPGR